MCKYWGILAKGILFVDFYQFLLQEGSTLWKKGTEDVYFWEVQGLP